MHRIYLAVLINQVRHETRFNTGNEYAQAILRIVREVSTAPTFLAMGSDKVWAVGTSERVLPDDEYPGGNALGQVLTKLSQLMFEDELDTFDGLTTDHLLHLSTFHRLLSGGKSVFVLSDSGGRLTDFIQQGRVFRRGGKTMGEVAEAAKNEGIDLSGYRWIIVSGFTNDARKSNHVWETSFKQLQSFIGPEIERRGHQARSTILYSLELPLNNIKNSREHLEWLRGKLASYEVAVQGWSDKCMFVDGSGQCIEKFFADSIHLNEVGVYHQWRNWSQFFDSELQMLKIRLDTKYAAEREVGGTRGDRLRRMSPGKAKGIRQRKNKAQRRRKTRKFLIDRKSVPVKDLRNLLSKSRELQQGTSTEIRDETGKVRRAFSNHRADNNPIVVVDIFSNRRVVTGVGQPHRNQRRTD